ncbi:MAG TPA: 5'-deoxynucleotidase [Candidatus Fimenecus excrementavium]|nr:5'-deoxynucleotidase [Candidatus Fimenecus excrementavium]
MKGNFFAFISRMKYINRWALMRNTNYETLSQHSFEVASLAHALAVIGNRRLGKNYDTARAALLGLYHDAPEIITGDMPTPVKYHSGEMREAFATVERYAGERLLSMLPEDMQLDFRPLLQEDDADAELHKLVKAADKLSAYIKCVEERKAGNTEFKEAEKTTKATLEKLGCPEAEIFTAEFLRAYELPLDKLK